MIDKGIKIKYEPHVTISKKCIPYLFCRVCGLVYLNNEATKRAIKKGHKVYYLDSN